MDPVDGTKMSINEASAKIRICRLCLAQTTIYFSLIENKIASEMLRSLTAMEIHPYDEISTVMCYKCRLNLKLAYNIQQNMLKAEQRFQTLSAMAIDEKFQVLEENEQPSIKQELEEVPTNVNPTAPYTCPICDKPFRSREKFTIHKGYCNKKSSCPTCGKQVSSCNLSQHMEVHFPKKVVCELCGAIVKSKANLKVHMKFKHQPAREKCSFCERVFKGRIAVKRHEQKEHLKEANFVCDTCGKKFYANDYLKKHIDMKHLKLRPHICEVCNHGFSSVYALKTHQRQHTDERPYKCEVCGEGFRQKVSLKSHLKSKHKIEEEITCHCSVCGKGFASNVALYTHMRVHDL